MAKDHTELGISFAELGALYGVRAMLVAGVLRTTLKPDTHVFDMECTWKPNGECGSIACIGGTMALIMGYNRAACAAYVGGQENPNLELLFYPDESRDWDWITPKIAVKAIDNFLATGLPKWETLRPKKRKSR